MDDRIEVPAPNVPSPDQPQPKTADVGGNARAGRGDEGVTPGQQAETPKPLGSRVPLPPDHPSRGMIDEGGAQG